MSSPSLAPRRAATPPDSARVAFARQADRPASCAAWLAGGPDLIYDNVYGADLPDAIANGDVALISVVVEDRSGTAATHRAVRDGHSQYGVLGNPVLRDNREQLEVIAGVEFWPWLVVLDETMTVRDDGLAYAGMLALTQP